MSNFKAKPKQINLYPRILATFERKRLKDWVKDKASFQANWKKISGPFKDFIAKIPKKK